MVKKGEKSAAKQSGSPKNEIKMKSNNEISELKKGRISSLKNKVVTLENKVEILESTLKISKNTSDKLSAELEN